MDQFEVIQNINDRIPLYIIFILILIISANSLLPLFPCRFQKILGNNMLVKHLFAFFIMIFSVILTSHVKDNKNINNIFSISIILYLIFILITKCNEYFFFLIIALLGISYLITIEKTNKKDNYNKTKKELEIYEEIITTIYVTIILFIICGVIIYMGKKKYQYKNNFNYYDFFFGVCKIPLHITQSDKISISKSLEHSFL